MRRGTKEFKSYTPLYVAPYHENMFCSDEKGFNVVTLTDCTAAMSEEGQAGATGGTYGMFSSPMTKDEFLATVAP